MKKFNLNKTINREISTIMVIGSLFITLFYFPLAYAQQEQFGFEEKLKDEEPTLHFNLDYFTAHQTAQSKHLLYLVERAHLNPNVFAGLRAGNLQGQNVGDLDYTLRRFPNHPTALQLMGSATRITNRYDLGLFYFKKAVGLYPQYALTHAQYGEYLASIGRVSEGITELKKALEMDPKLAPAYAWLAKAYRLSGHSELARQADEQAKKLGYLREIPKEAKKDKSTE